MGLSMRNAKGFTLIEVLIAMLLLSIVMFIGSLSFSVFSQRWQKDMGDFTQQAEQAKKLFLLQRTLQGISNYFVLDPKKEPVYFFLGSSTHLVFVTNRPIFASEGQALVRLTVLPLEGGQQQLVYQETDFMETPLYNLEHLPEPKQSLILLTAENIRFNYFGWATMLDKASFYEGEGTQPIWQDEYLAQKTATLPYAINLSWGKNEPIIFPLANDNGFQLLFTNEKRIGA